MNEAFSRKTETLPTTRLAALTDHQPNEFLVSLGIDLQDLDSVQAAMEGVGVVASPEDVVRNTFARVGYRAGRYNDTDFPAYYSALDEQTCIAEISYHLNRDAKANFALGPRYFRVIEVTFSGDLLDLCGHETRIPDLVSLTEAGYPVCRDIARFARNSKIDALKAPSARRKGGICLPIFSLSSISQPRQVGRYIFQLISGELSIAKA